MTDADVDLSFVDRAVAEFGRGREAVIPILQALQEHYRWLPEPALRRVCEVSEITPALIAGVSTFYNQFRHRPAGKFIINICHGTACHVKGALAIQDALAQRLSLTAANDTSPDGLFTVEKVACLGCCTLAPVIQIEGVTYGHLTPDIVPAVIKDFLEVERAGALRAAAAERERAGAPAAAAEIRVGLGSCCQARGSRKVFEAMQAAVKRGRLDVEVKRVGCVGMCHQTPLVEIVKGGARDGLYALVKAEDAEPIVRRHFAPRGMTRRVSIAVSSLLDRLYTGAGAEPVTRYALEVRDPPVAAFLGRQKHIATEHCGFLDPLDIDDYLSRDGFTAFERVLADRAPDRIIDVVTKSHLRGRGGAGYPTGLKWAHVRAANGGRKHTVCNGDEGDPGAFMDRMLLESYPYRVIEGLAIAAYAVGANEGYFYIRAEYPLAVERVRAALARCVERGFLGENIRGSGFSFTVKIMEGAGAFVCGEETALLASIEGRRGMPRLRPPYPAVRGLWGNPTLINNVETYAIVPWIMRNGAEAFAALGTQKSPGTKVFALAGKIARGGLIEVPMGITLREIVEDIGGGVAGERKFKAVQVGGPSGGCIPAALADTPVDYEALTHAGAIMGSGGLVVLDDTDCMVDIARYFLDFTQNQSCGKCTFCRIGTRRMLDILERLCAGLGKPGDLTELEELARNVKRGSICGLGKTAPNPVLTTLKYFRDEYEAHLEKRCPAGRCKALIRYVVTDDCIGCTLCSQHCPADAIPMRPYEKHEIDLVKCTRCDTCRRVCPATAIKVE